MNQTLQPLSGQSNFDICLSTVGRLDGLMALLSANGITNTNMPPVNTITYNTNSILSLVTANYPYATGVGVSVSAIPLLNNDGTPLQNNDGENLFNN